MKFDFSGIMTLRVAVVAVGIAIALLVLTFVWLEWTLPPAAGGNLLAVLTVIPAPTGTPVPAPTATWDPSLPTPTPVALPGQISLGAYVQIKGTGGQGLHIRSSPGLNSDQLFLGYDAEVFVVKDGPRQADGYTWYYLVAPYDDTRAGWAASNFLNIIPAPTR
jgi:hypothetical protein